MRQFKIIAIIVSLFFATNLYASDLDTNGGVNVRLIDQSSNKFARIDESGRLLVTSVSVSPPDTTPVIQSALSSISANTDTIYTITNGTTLVFQQFEAGSEQNTTGGSRVFLYEDPNGDLSVLNLIAVLYVNGDSAFIPLSRSFTGDGTRRIVMRRAPIGGPSREVYGRWRGFEE